MLNLESRFYCGIALVSILIFAFSCKNKNEDIRQETTLYKNYSKSIALDDYDKVFRCATDTLKSWKVNNLEDYEFLNLYSYRVDSLICFNSWNNKLIGTILISNKFSKSNYSDGLVILYGVRISKVWFFFTGATIVLPREYYQKDIHTPLSFEQLHEIAMKEVFSGYLKENPQGKWEVNEDFFDGISKYDAYNHRFTTQESYEESVLRLVRANWEKRN